MPSAQKLLDRGIKLRRVNIRNRRKNRNICSIIVCEFLKDLCIQPLLVIRAIQCLLNPGNEKYPKKHSEVKVKYQDFLGKKFSVDTKVNLC